MELTFVEWTQHPVGHGGFHTGVAVTDDETAFNWIFDCGARGAKFMGRALKREIDAWAKTTPKVIDWLFISHFDLDHVRGLDALFTHKKVRDVMLPYLNEHELVHTLCEGLAWSTAPAWYVRFVDDPTAWLAERGVDRIVFLNGPDDPDQRPYPASEPEKPREGTRKEDGWKVTLSPHPMTAGKIANTIVAVSQGGTCNVSASNGRVTLRLRPYRAPTDPLRHLFLLTALKHIAGWSPSTPTGAGLLPGVAGLGGLAAALAQVARTEAGRKKIQRAYALGIGSSNRSSLSLMSVPEVDVRKSRTISAVGRGGVHEITEAPEPPAWINTGDAELLDDDDLRDWRRWYGRWLPQVRILALPHHGSDHNSGPDFQKLNRHALLVAHVSKGAAKHPGPATSAHAAHRLVSVTGEEDSRLMMWFAALT